MLRNFSLQCCVFLQITLFETVECCVFSYNAVKYTLMLCYSHFNVGLFYMQHSVELHVCGVSIPSVDV